MQRIGVIGGGQLAWMMAGAAKKLGVKLVVQTPSKDDPAIAIASDWVLADIDDAAATARLACLSDVVTFENEFVDLTALQQLEQRGVRFRPRLGVLAPLLDKYEQRQYLHHLNLPVPQFAAVTPDFEPSFPCVLKTRRHGYDGYGTVIIRDRTEWDAALANLRDRPLLVEEFVPFERELAAIAARSVSGEFSLYPIVETQQVNQVCRRVFAPVRLEPSIALQIESITRTLLESLDAIGVLAIELFLTADQKVLINEIAPRVHNSGHFSLDACETSQFEQHLRAIAGLPLGNPVMRYPQAVMVNLLGYEVAQSDYAEKRKQLEQIPHSFTHWYGKSEARPGRKLGHVTVLLKQEDRHAAEAIAQEIEAIWYGDA
ncbi:MAG TPA: 5-(carboxyamino)imidazole ribonucleotide synthase [Leptolyngbyaceae cyanobacterium M33_DOE_097]|uniref:N5-carboxyaminoimidazole ribonucleotide synthase n=1 Tax=Oscillatoriales cyanobacterium SpSt-418 TaxID=2282169 RepID=A0A7C3PFD8_9CYAN|nr:5-(carboxyamino)imidazole ribonucleotide synthase [Leptolyngbyaceae cyanobacterium M33_DOE_097]